MEHRPNSSSINFYSEKYASMICNQHFKDHEAITGKQILDVTPTRQVNLFVVKNIFEAWLKETQKLKSPYFNYEVPEVQQSLHSLMNHLSRNILISVTNFKPLLRQAVADTLNLLLFPSEYYIEMFSSKGKRFQFESEVLPLFKYIKTHEKIAELLKEELAKEGRWVRRKDAINIVEVLIEENNDSLDKPYDLIREFNEIVPVGIYEIAPTWEDTAVVDPDFSPSMSAKELEMNFDILYNKAEDKPPVAVPKKETPPQKEQVEWKAPPPEQKQEQPAPKEETPTPTPSQEKEAQKPIRRQAEFAPRKDELEGAFEEENKKQPSSYHRPAVEKVTEEENPLDRIIQQNTPRPILNNEEEDEEESTEGTLLQKLAQQAAAINKKESESDAPTPAPKASLLDKLTQEKKVNRKKLKGSIPLNEQILFQNKLFGGNEADLHRAIDMIDDAEDYHSAMGQIKQNFLYKYDWNLSDDATVKFLSMIDDKF